MIDRPQQEKQQQTINWDSFYPYLLCKLPTIFTLKNTDGKKGTFDAFTVNGSRFNDFSTHYSLIASSSFCSVPYQYFLHVFFFTYLPLLTQNKERIAKNAPNYQQHNPSKRQMSNKK